MFNEKLGIYAVYYFSFLSITDYSDLTDEILKFLILIFHRLEILTFLSEHWETYFVPPKLKRHSIDGKSERPRGRLVDKFHNNLQLIQRAAKRRTSTINYDT